MKALMIGTGMVARTHLLALRDNTQGVRLCGVHGRSGDKTTAFAASAETILGYPVPVIADLAAARPDLAIVLTPPDARAEIVSVLAQNRVPILMEKPIERDLTRATALVETCERAGVPLGIVLQHRLRAASVALSRRLQDGALGQITSAEIRVPWWREQAYYDEPGRGTYARDGGGVMISQAIHTLDLALALLGPVDRLQALMHTTPLHTMQAEDWAGALLQFASGARATLNATTASYPGSAESIAIHGSLGSAHLESGKLRLWFRGGTTEDIGEDAATGGGADPMAFSHAWHQSILEDFALALRENRPPVATGRQALRAHAVIDAMERANRSGRIEEVSQ